MGSQRYYNKLSHHGRCIFLALPENWLRSQSVRGCFPEVIEIRTEDDHLELRCLPPSKQRIETESAIRNEFESSRDKNIRQASEILNKITGTPKFVDVPGEDDVSITRLINERVNRRFIDLDAVEDVNDIPEATKNAKRDG